MGPRGQRLARRSGRNDNCCWNCRRDNEGDGKWGGTLVAISDAHSHFVVQEHQYMGSNLPEGIK